MMKLDDAKTTIQEILTASLDGKLPDHLEEHLNRLQRDYEEYYSQEGDTGNEWRGKYEQLKEKYVSRFMSEPGQTEEKMSEKVVKNNEEQIVGQETSSIEDITLDDIFEEVK